MEIPIKNKNIVTLVSPEDYENVKSKSLFILNTKSGKKYVLITINSSLILLHHYIIGKPPKGQIVDHRNGNELDNRRENLRFVTYSINNQNRIKNKNASSQYFGVCWIKNQKKWQSSYSGIKIGYFDIEEEAAIAYDIYVLANFDKEYKTNNLIDIETIDMATIKELSEKQLIRKKKTNTSLPIGVTQSKSGTYIATIYDNNDKKSCCLGRFKTIEEAENAYKTKKQEFQDRKPKPSQDIIRNGNGIAIINTYNIKGEITAEILIDDDKWFEYSQKKCWLDNDGYAVSKIGIVDVPIHKQLLAGDLIDHRNKIRTDNRMANLRISNKANNGHNRTKKKTATSGYYGVYFDNTKKQYRAAVIYKGVKYSLGIYGNQHLAAIAYNIGATELYKDFANLNEITDPEIKLDVKKETDLLSYIQKRLNATTF